MLNKTSKEADMMIFGEKFRTIKCNCWSATNRLQDMKKHQIDLQGVLKRPRQALQKAPKTTSKTPQSDLQEPPQKAPQNVIQTDHFKYQYFAHVFENGADYGNLL